MYVYFKCRVLHNGKLSDSFEVTSGEGPVVYLFLARTPGIGQGLGRILSCGARKPEHTSSFKRLEYLEYADNVCLLSQASSHLKKNIDAISLVFRSNGLVANISKAKLVAGG